MSTFSFVQYSQGNPPPPSATHDYPSRNLSKGDALYYLGDDAQVVYHVEEGLLKLSLDLVSGRERIVSIVGPGDYLGAITPLHHTYQESAEALSPRVRVGVLSKEQHELQDALHAASGLYLSRLRDALEDTDLPVNARLARAFLRLGQRFGHTSDEGQVRLTLPLTHDNFAAMVGAARETTTATLGEMRDVGVISGTRGRYSFHQGELADFAVSASF